LDEVVSHYCCFHNTKPADSSRLFSFNTFSKKIPMKLKTTFIKLIADTFTPVNIYLKLRDQYPGSILLESSENKGLENNFSYICCNPVASFEVSDNEVTINKEGKVLKKSLTKNSVTESLAAFITSFEYEEVSGVPFKTNGLFGYISYEAIPLFETISFKSNSNDIPLINFQVFRNVIVINHYNNEIYIFDHLAFDESNINEISSFINNRSQPKYSFSSAVEEESNFTDEEYIGIVKKGIAHCKIGDVFQIVLSRKFRKKFKGDDFNLYRSLRSINPSPYLFYFDYGSFRVFGSSPEAQLVINKNEASIFPIAGTFKRTGREEDDLELAENLKADGKENAEHVMLVDLARNDLSRNSDYVQIKKYREVQFFSHVIHLVSKVSAKLESTYNPVKVLGDTFPAGTLSGAPKFKAMELIDSYENESRNLYGGCIGMIGFDGSLNTAIIIRSFFSCNNVLEYQAGAGVVSASIPENELEEVNNKLRALREAIKLANTI